MKTKSWNRALTTVACTVALAGVTNPAYANPSCGHDHDEEEVAGVRDEAAKRVGWKKKAPRPARVQGVQILGFNDFHGQLSAGRLVSGRPVGSAAVMASYFKAEETAFNGETVLAHAGDFVGASPAASALLQDEPSIQFLNLLGNQHCKRKNDRHKKCNIIGTLGNHELDEGVDELFRLLDGGNHPNGPFLQRRWTGAHFPYVSSNVVDAETGEPILPPYVVQQIGKARVAFIGAVLEGTPLIVTPTGVAGLTFLDEAESINKYIPEIKAKGVEAIVVLIHQGGRQNTYTGPTSPTSGAIIGDIVGIVARLDAAVDVVVSGHSHSFSNGLLPNAGGVPTLVTQAFSASTAYGDIELTIDLDSGDVVEKSAAIVTTWADEGPGLTPVAEVAELTAAAEALVAPLVNEEVGVAATDITRAQNPAGESALGNLIADSQRASVNADVAFMNPGGIRQDFAAGPVTWGEAFTVQPFGNTVTTMNMTGTQILALLEQQFVVNRILQISGITYTWDAAAPVGSRIVSVQIGGAPLDPAATYFVAANNFIATGGDGFSVFTGGTNQQGGPVDIDALIDYIQTLTQPFSAVIEGRITRSN
jgi:5'-nucleotidase